MPKILSCYLDVDGVIANFVAGICKLRGRKNPYEVNRAACLGVWETEKLLGISLAEFWEGVNYDYWRNLGFMHDGRKIVDVVKEHFAPERICLCTAPGGDRGSIDGKLDWIEEHFPELRRYAFVGTGKGVHANPHTLLIDDRNENCDAFRAAGGNVIQVPRTWNRRYMLDHLSVTVVKQELAQAMRS